MAQYIDKNALLDWAKETYLCENASMIRKVCYKQLVEHLNTLEVKEVDLKNIKSVFEGQYLTKDKVVTIIERLQDECEEQGDNNGVELLEKLFNKLDILEVTDPYEHLIHYPSREDDIKAHAEDYSWNIESELFNQLSLEQQKLWRKEIEQACISGGYCGLNLQKDRRYDDNLEVKKVNLEKELKTLDDTLFDLDGVAVQGATHYLTVEDVKGIAKHFFELGMEASNKAQKGE